MPSGNLIAPAEWNGVKGLISYQGEHETDPQSFIELIDVLYDQDGRRHKRPGIGTPIDNVAAAGEITNMHFFIRTDPTTGARTWTVFRTHGSNLFRWSGIAWVAVVLGTLPAFTGTAWRFANYKNRCYFVNGVDGLFYYDGTTGATDGREVYRAGIATPTAAIGYSLVAVDQPYSTGTVTATQGSKLVVGDGATTWNNLGGWDEKFIDINGVRYQIDTVTVASPGQLLLTEEYRGATTAGLPYVIYIGYMDWNEPPIYTYGYRNPTTGHVSNVGPLLTLNERDVVGRTPRLQNIPYSATDFVNGFTEIQIYRSAKNGTVPVAILSSAGGTIANANIVGTTVFTETVNTFRDTALSKFPAPITSNERPLNNAGTGTPALSAIAVWADRLFVLSPRDAKLFYSAATWEIEYGRADECFPSIHFLTVDDGRGLVRIGSGNNDVLVIQTGAEEKYVDGFDVRDFLALDLPGARNVGSYGLQAINARSSLTMLCADKRLIDFSADDFPEGDIGRKIQNKLDLVPDAYIEKARLVWFSYAKRNVLLLSVPGTKFSTQNDKTYVFDRDSRQWAEWSVGFSAFARVYDATTGKLELWAANAATRKVHKLFQENVFTDDGANFTPRMKSPWMRPFGYGKAALWKWFKAYVGQPAEAWKVKTFVDGDAAGEQFDLVVTGFQRQSAGGNELESCPPTDRKKRGEMHQIELIWPTTGTALWVDKIRSIWTLDQDVEETG